MRMGNIIDSKSSMKYLGAQLQADGKNDSEIAQKIGEAGRSFKNLKRIWNHSSISQKFKYQIFLSCVIQKLLYSLESTWLSAKIRKKLDGFWCSCLRQILGISHSFISRVSNNHILNHFDTVPLSSMLLERQLILYGKIARLPDDHPTRLSIFQPGSFSPASYGVRRRGRPRYE